VTTLVRRGILSHLRAQKAAQQMSAVAEGARWGDAPR